MTAVRRTRQAFRNAVTCMRAGANEIVAGSGDDLVFDMNFAHPGADPGRPRRR